MTARLGMVLGALLGLAACGDAAPDVDADLVDALTELHLADARAAIDTADAWRDVLADSLRTVALATHGLDSATLAARLDALAADPDLSRATYDSVEARLVRERQGALPDSVPVFETF